jgi:hypothetical protein
MKIDERDTLFARLSLRTGSDEYHEYYQKNPHFKLIDDSLRRAGEEKKKLTSNTRLTDKKIILNSLSQSMQLEFRDGVPGTPYST